MVLPVEGDSEGNHNKPVFDPVGVVMLVFVGLLLQESTTSFFEVWAIISEFHYERSLLLLAMLFYWLNILRICLGFARSLGEGKSAYMMGMSTFIAGISSLVLAYISIALISSHENPFSHLGWNEELAWSCFYLVPNLAYLIWDLVLIARDRNGDSDLNDKRCLFVWLVLDAVFFLGVVLMFFLDGGYLMMAMILTAIIVVLDYSYNRNFYFSVGSQSDCQYGGSQ